jgi:peptidoglycan/LPS O-acetylase OafA/YrhL
MKYIRGFDGLRAVSIILVLLTHLGIDKVVMSSPFFSRFYFLFFSVTGVMIFFTISGFLITLLLLKEKKASGRIDFKNFLIRRFLRLFPLLFVFYIVIFVLMGFGILERNYEALFLSFLYLYNFVPRYNYTGELAHTWSLGIEEQFYLFWPLIISFLKKYKNLVLFSLLLVSVSFLWSVFYPVLALADDKIRFLNEGFYLERWFIPACLPIITGALTAIILLKKENALQKLFYKTYIFLLLAFVVYFMQLFIPGMPDQLVELFKPFGVAILLVWIYYNQASILVNILEFKPISFIGKISYGIYVYQGLFLRTGPGGELKIQHFPLNIILVFAMAILSYFLIEKPIMRFKNRFRPVKKLNLVYREATN